MSITQARAIASAVKEYIKAIISQLRSYFITQTLYGAPKSNDQDMPRARRSLARRPIRDPRPGDPHNLVLLGKTGHEKSALGNTIFGKERFELQFSSSSVTAKRKMEQSVLRGRKIFLVDTPGTMDTNQGMPLPRPAITALPPGDPLNLVLLGKTGHGKSALGNTIFGEERFESRLSSISVTKTCKMEHAVLGGREIFLVDTPGTMDTNDPESALLEIYHAITLRPEGFHAFLLVLNPTVRMTKEENMAVMLLTKMFGEDVLRKYTVLVFTHGDDYSRQMENAQKNKSFQDYISSQGGDLGQLVTECNFRCVLINNMERDATTVNTQVRELINVIDELVSQNDKKMYTNGLFEFARVRIEEETNKYLEQFAGSS